MKASPKDDGVTDIFASFHQLTMNTIDRDLEANILYDDKTKEDVKEGTSAGLPASVV